MKHPLYRFDLGLVQKTPMFVNLFLNPFELGDTSALNVLTLELGYPRLAEPLHGQAFTDKVTPQAVETALYGAFMLGYGEDWEHEYGNRKTLEGFHEVQRRLNGYLAVILSAEGFENYQTTINPEGKFNIHGPPEIEF